jgi:GcrA cell cycle regulator
MEQSKNYLSGKARPWTEPTVRRLIGLWRERLSAARIARALGPEFTRSAVVGKLARMGLSRSDEQRREAQSAGARSVRRRSRPPALPPIPLPPPAPCAVVPRLVGILELTPSTCRWPYGAGDEVRFCGHGTAPAGPYCPGHREVAYAGALPPLTLEALEAAGHAPSDR